MTSLELRLRKLERTAQGLRTDPEIALAQAVEGKAAQDPAPPDWRDWLEGLFPASVCSGFADHHVDFWIWVWGIDDRQPRPLVVIWPRGGGKSTAGELACVALGARGKRRYIVYVQATQEQADQRVGNIALLLESDAIAHHYPSLGSRAIGKYGAPRGWRRNRLHTTGGLIVDGLGLDVAVVSEPLHRTLAVQRFQSVPCPESHYLLRLRSDSF